MQLKFRVIGVPKPGGSKKAFVIPGTNRASVTEDSKKNREWRNDVISAFHHAYPGVTPISEALSLEIEFLMPRPRNHYGTGSRSAILKPNAPFYHSVKPDRTKLVRSTEDALTGVAYRDDTQVVTGNVTKRYTTDEAPGAIITITLVGSG